MRVLEYVQQDVRITLEVALAVLRRHGLRWIARSWRDNAFPITQWLTVVEAQQLPKPDTAWMATPIDRTAFATWLKAFVAE